MKKIVQNMAVLLMVGSLLSLTSLTPVLAAESGSASTSQKDKTTTSDNSSTDDSSTTPAASAEAKSKMAERVALRKNEFKIVLTTAAATRIKLRCKVAQTAIKGFETRSRQPLVNRQNVYKNVVTKLTALRDKLKTANVDTAALDTEITQLNAKITAYNTALTTLSQADADLQAIDCVSDPVAFKASLEAARVQFQAVIKAASDVKTYAKNVIEPTLVTLRAAVDAKNKES